MSEQSADPSQTDMSETAVPGLARLIDVMGPIRDSGTRIAEFLGETAMGLATGQHDLGGAARQARSALTPLACADTMAARLSQANQARSVLESLRGRAVALRAIASLSKLTARSMGSDRFDDYTENLGNRSTDLGKTAERVRETLSEVTDHISSAGIAAQDAVDALDVLLGAIADRSDAPPSPEAQGARLTGLADAARALRDRLWSDLNGLVSLMQFSDAFRQRMEHVETLARRAELSAITRAQLEALAADTQAAILETQDRVGRLSALATEAAGHFHEDGMAADALREASLQHAALDTAVQQAASVSRAANVVREGAEVLQRSMQVAREALSTLQDQSEDIGLSAINSLLLARGDERTSRAMSNLAAAVGEHARNTSAELATCKSLMEQLTTGSDTMATAVVAHAEALEGILDGARRDLQAEDARAASRQAGESTALQSVKDLESALADATRALDALRPVPDRLKARAQDLGAPGAVPDRAAADAVRAIYTMQRERDVHDAVFGIAPSEETATDTSEEQDLDDIFF
jgi:hypothetical protein